MYTNRKTTNKKAKMAHWIATVAAVLTGITNTTVKPSSANGT
jgi:hypothetical protein